MRPRNFRFHYTTFDKRDGKELHYFKDHLVSKRYPTLEEIEELKTMIRKHHSSHMRIDILSWSEMGR